MAAVGVIETARLMLRPFRDDDAEAAHAVWGDAEVMRHSIAGPTQSLDGTRAHIARHQQTDKRDGYAFRAIVERSTGTLIGVGGLLNMPEDWNAVEVGYRLRRDRWGRGYATEAARAWLRAGFETLGLQEIVGVVSADNPASIGVLEKAGLLYRGEGLYHGFDVLHFAAERESWLKHHG